MPTWKSILELDGDGMEQEQFVAIDLGRRLEVLVNTQRVTTLSSHKVFEGLDIAELIGVLAGLDCKGAEEQLRTQRALVSLNNIVHIAPNAVGAALAEHGVVDALLRINKRVRISEGREMSKYWSWIAWGPELLCHSLAIIIPGRHLGQRAFSYCAACHSCHLGEAG